jgi:hypothetical protein
MQSERQMFRLQGQEIGRVFQRSTLMRLASWAGLADEWRKCAWITAPGDIVHRARASVEPATFR